LGPQFVGGWDSPVFGHAFSNRTYFGYGRVPFNELAEIRGRKKIIIIHTILSRHKVVTSEAVKKEESVAKPKSTDKYVGRPNNNISTAP